MVALLFLGIIPGTTIQINFDDWLRLVAILCALLLIAAALRKQRILTLLIALTIRRATQTVRLA